MRIGAYQFAISGDVNENYKEIEKAISLFRKVFSESSSDINMYIIHIFIIFIHF